MPTIRSGADLRNGELLKKIGGRKNDSNIVVAKTGNMMYIIDNDCYYHEKTQTISRDKSPNMTLVISSQIIPKELSIITTRITKQGIIGGKRPFGPNIIS